MKPSPAGFTLIELMIAVAIVSLLATVALPTYREQMRKSRRAEAQAYVMAVAARQSQFLVDTRAYSDSLVPLGVPMPANVASAYNVSLAASAGPPPTFTVTATPKNDQVNEACGTLAIDHGGSKSATKGGTAVQGCW